MLSRCALTRRARTRCNSPSYALTICRRELHYDGRNRLSNFWTPTQRQPTDLTKPEHGHDLLARAGFLRQAHSGIFHLLPLGLRVQNKIEQLIDKYMLGIGASKVSLSSLSSEELWQRSGRLDEGRSSELLRLEDRKGAKYLLSPTHEEEITTIVANAVHSYRELPLRLYQVSRKYRDEPRPRQGLLRGREFLMKDLYTFDVTEDAARETYEDVRKAYVGFLDELRLPYLVARASSGNMGGTLSHEYHFASPQGEDTVVRCDTCEYSINEELYVGKRSDSTEETTSSTLDEIASEHYVSKDRTKLCSIHYVAVHGEPNIYAVKMIFPDIDTGLQGDDAWREYYAKSANPVENHILYHDPRLSIEHLIEEMKPKAPENKETPLIPIINKSPILLTKARTGDACPNCADGKIDLHQAVEIGHTFHLGTRYSVPLEAHVLAANNRQVPIEMGCHGIGVSRLIGAIAALLADSKGLNWPLAIAPFEVAIVGAGKTETVDVDGLYDLFAAERKSNQGIDAVIDDRDRPVGWKLNDADLIGYPFIVVMGNAWRDTRAVELQCRRLGLKLEVGLDELVDRLEECRARL